MPNMLVLPISFVSSSYLPEREKGSISMLRPPLDMSPKILFLGYPWSSLLFSKLRLKPCSPFGLFGLSWRLDVKRFRLWLRPLGKSESEYFCDDINHVIKRHVRNAMKYILVRSRLARSSLSNIQALALSLQDGTFNLFE